MRLGVDRFLEDPGVREKYRGRRMGLLAHPASVTSTLRHSLDALASLEDIDLVAVFGPQHGIRGEKQDNMVETPDAVDPRHGIPVFSLYSETRRPTREMLDSCDVFLVDLQDLGCRVYTFATTLLYFLEAGAAEGKTIVVLDRPNPIGRPVEGLLLEPGCESFVGAAPMPMRHGLTLGELALWYVRHLGIDVDLEVVPLEDWKPDAAPGFGWPVFQLSWVNPSPNAATLSMARCYPGTVLLEGTMLSEGRGTTRALEVLGAPDIETRGLLEEMRSLAPEWLEGCDLRPSFFEPTFQKYVGELCSGFQVHVDGSGYDHGRFRPYRLIALALKALRRLRPEYDLWRNFPYEYVTDRLAIDVIAGGSRLREWVDDPASTPRDLEVVLSREEKEWGVAREPFLLY